MGKRATVSAAIVSLLEESEIQQFHNDRFGHLQFQYYSLLLRYGGSFASHLTEQVLHWILNKRLRSDRRVGWFHHRNGEGYAASLAFLQGQRLRGG